MSLIEAIILGFIEGLTEFLPVSSTGHLILASEFMKISNNDFHKSFEISIQLGAILAVLFLYYKRFIINVRIYRTLAIAFFPTLVIGLLAYSFIKTYLFNSYVVSVNLILGGIILILLNGWVDHDKNKSTSIDNLSLWKSIKIGLFQCISMMPGVSRSAATIIGGIYSGLGKKEAIEFSFLLAIPTMFVATGYDLFKTGHLFNGEELRILLAGGISAFIFALLAVKTFIAFVEKFGFRFFGYYRIILGILFLLIK